MSSKLYMNTQAQIECCFSNRLPPAALNVYPKLPEHPLELLAKRRLGYAQLLSPDAKSLYGALGCHLY